MLTKLRTTLAGRKTYLVAVAAILTALAAWSEREISTFELLQTAFASAAAITMRAGIKRGAAAVSSDRSDSSDFSAPPTPDRGGPGNRGVFPRGSTANCQLPTVNSQESRP